MLVSKSMPVSILSKMAYKAKAFELVKLRLSVLVFFCGDGLSYRINYCRWLFLRGLV